MRSGNLRAQESDGEPATGQEVLGDLAVLVGAARDLVALEHNDGRDPGGDRQGDEEGLNTGAFNHR